MTQVGIHSKPVNGVIMNGHAPQPDDPGQSRTMPDKRERRRDGAAFIVVALLNAAVVAVVAFSGSWQHQYELSVQLGQAHWVAGMQPLSVEGLIAAATLVIWYAGRHGYRRRDAWAAYVVLAAGVGQTVLMNLGADYRWPWLGPEISVWPAVAFVAAYEMAVWLVRKRQDAAPRHDMTAEQPTVTPWPVKGDKPRQKVTRKPTLKELAAAEGVSVRTLQRRNRNARRTT